MTPAVVKDPSSGGGWHPRVVGAAVPKAVAVLLVHMVAVIGIAVVLAIQVTLANLAGLVKRMAQAAPVPAASPAAAALAALTVAMAI